MHDDYMNTEETAAFLKVSKSLVEKWRRKGVFLPDVIGHDKRGRGKAYYYSRERILQLASVFKKKNDGNRKVTDDGNQTATEEELDHVVAVLANDKQTRIEMALEFLNLLFGAVVERLFGYLWTKQDKATYPFAVSNSAEREAMARKAIELSDAGKDVYFGVNLMNDLPARNARVKAEFVTLQTATVADIDILGGTHTDPDKYPANIEMAKGFLPFPVSMLVDSGYGLHPYCLYAKPIAITAENRSEVTKRNKKFIDTIRSRAGKYAKAVDSVHDLPRVLRMPGTYNYKGGRENAPLCRLIEVSDVRFTPTELDEKLNAMITPKKKSEQQKQHSVPPVCQSVDERDRALNMLAVVPVADLSRDEWLHVGMALKNNGNSVLDWEQWSRADERFKDGECEKLWQGFTGTGLTIATIHDIAKRYGYQEPSHSNHSDETGRDNGGRTRDRITDCPVNLILPKNFIWGNTGITLVVPPKKENDAPKYICVTRTPIVPTKIFREPKHNTFTYEIATLIRGVWRTTEITGRTLADPRAIITLADNGALILEPKILCRFLNDIISLNPDLNEIKAYDQPGWHDGKFIYPTGGKDCVVRRPGFNYEEEFATRGNPETFKTYLLEALDKGGAVARVFLGTGLLATLIQPLNILNAQIQLNSKSGGGKTALAKMTAAIFGNPRELIRTFGATEKNRQAVAAAYNDLPTFFDEMETMSGKRAEEQLSQMIYSFAEGKGNQAQKRDGTARQAFRFYGTRLMTAERPILKDNDLRGAYKRLVQIRCPKLFDDSFATDLHFIAESNFGHFGKPWTEYSTEHQKEIIQTFTGFSKIFADHPQNVEPTQLKSITGAVVALQYFLICIGAQSAFDSKTAASDIKEIIALLPTNAQLDDTARAVEALGSYVASHEKSFTRDETSNETGKPVEIGSWGTVCSGKIFDTGAVAVFPTELKRILEDELHFASADKLIAEWKEQGNILITDKGRTTHKIRIGKKTYNVIHFRAGILATDTDSAELNYYEELGVFNS